MPDAQYPESWQDSLGFRLLNRQSLLTPILAKAFGPLRALQTSYHQTPTDYCRYSEILQTGSDRRILEAVLTINKMHLPHDAIDTLMTTDVLFGQLLMNHKIEVELVGIEVFRRPDGRFGRRNDIYNNDGTGRIAQVEEVLASDVKLSEMIVGAVIDWRNA